MAYTVKQLKELADTIAQRDNITPAAASAIVNRLKESGQLENLAPDNIPTAQQDIVENEFVYLPPGLYEDICAIIDGFADSNNITDKTKIDPRQFIACCLLVGSMIKRRAILRDRERERVEGGRIYKPEAILELLQVYEYVCGQYRQVAFSFNFQKFSGISKEYFHDYLRRGLSSTRFGLVEKAKELERDSLSAAISSGGQSTVGHIFLGKALAGLQETVTIQHVSATAAPVSTALPVFDTSSGLLTDKQGE